MSGYTVAVARIGGCGGVQFSHQEYLTQNGFQMGCSKQGAVLTSLHVENWRVLSHMHATYTSRTGGASCVVPGVGNISAPDKAAHINIHPHERVVSVTIEHGFFEWAAGANCLNCISITTESVIDGSIRTSWCGQNNYTADDHALALATPAALCRKIFQGRLQAVKIPPGCTLAGLSGRAGGNWDQVVLHVCPFIPHDGCWNTDYHRRSVQPFKHQVQALLLCLHRCSEQSAHMIHHTTATAGAEAYLPHLPVEMKQQLVAALFKLTFLAESAARASAAAVDANMSPASNAMAVADSNSKNCLDGIEETANRLPSSCDYITTWLQQYALKQQ